MSENHEEVENSQSQPNASPDLLTQILSDRKSSYEKEVAERKSNKEEAVESSQKKESDSVQKKEEVVNKEKLETKQQATAKKEKEPKEEAAKKEKVVIDEDDDEEEFEDTKKVDKNEEILQKTKKSLSDTQKWGNSINRKMKAAMRQLDEDFDAGDLTESQYSKLKAALTADYPEPKSEVLSDSGNPLDKLINIAAEKLEYLKDALGDDELFEDKVRAFDFYMRDASPEERQDLYDELADLEDKPIKLAKKLFSIGEQHHEFYKEVSDAGGFKKLIEVKEKKLESAQKTIDKLRKKLSQYEDDDKPTNRIKELGLEVGKPEQQKSGDLLTNILNEHTRQVRSRRA